MTREDEIFRQIKQGNREGLDELIRLYYPEIFRYCFWHTTNRANAEDATQDTFFKAVRYLDRYAHSGKFRAFLYKVAANTCIDMSRRKYEEPVKTEFLDTFPVQRGVFEEVEADADFRELIGKLSGEAKELVLLRFGQELKLREIAAITGMPLRTVQSKLRAAVRQLKGIVVKKGECRS